MNLLKMFFIIGLSVVSVEMQAKTRPTMNQAEISVDAISNVNSEKLNTVYIELLGRSFFYGVGYQRQLGRDVAAGLSFSYISGKFGAGEAEVKAKAFSIPLYVNYYAYKYRRHHFLVTGGLNIFSFEAQARVSDQAQAQIANQARAVSAQINGEESDSESNSFTIPDLKLDGSGTLALPQVGLGYEYRSRGGLFVNSNLYAIYVIQKVIPWAGLSVGIQF